MPTVSETNDRLVLSARRIKNWFKTRIELKCFPDISIIRVEKEYVNQIKKVNSL